MNARMPALRLATLAAAACAATWTRPGHGSMFGRCRWRSTRLANTRFQNRRSTEGTPVSYFQSQRPMVVIGIPLACSKEKALWWEP